MAIGSPTGTTLPASTRSLRTTPLADDSTSTVALSVSISASTSPLLTFSPSFFTQRTSTPSCISKPSLGMEIVSDIISRPPSPPQQYQAPAGGLPAQACGCREAGLLFARPE